MRPQTRWKRKTTTIATSLFAAALVLTSAMQGLVPGAEAATYLVSPGSLQDWAFQTDGSATGSLVAGPGTPPLGTGSLKFDVGANGDDGVQFRNTAYDDTPLADLTSLAYATYVEENVNCQAPYLILSIDSDNNGTQDDALYFEPCYQTGGYGGTPVPNQGEVALNTWQTWNALEGGWWAYSDGLFGPPLITIEDYLTEHPNARIMNFVNDEEQEFGAVRIIAGYGAGAWDDFVGYADAFRIGVDGVENTYNFEATGPAASSSSSVTTSSSSLSSTGSSISSSSSSLSSVVCDIYADAVTAFAQGDEKGGTDVAANRSVTANALGSPTAGSAPRFVSLGFSGSITIRFDNYVVNGTGADLRVYESTNATSYPLESAQVWASHTGTGAWTLLGTADSSDNLNGDLNTSDLDLGALPWARYFRLVDTTNPSVHATGADAFDLNALQALNNSCSQPGPGSSSSSVSSSSSSSSVSSSVSSSSTGSSISSSSSSSSSPSSVSSSSVSSSSLSSSSVAAGPVPTCNGMVATVYVDEDGIIVGGRDDGEEFDEVLRGGNGDDVIAGTAGNDRIYGGSGDDVICGAGGDDELDGGNGQDKLAGEGGEDELDGGNSQDLLCGHADDDVLDAGNASDQLDGGDGDDDLDAGNGQDVCRNGEDNDDCESSGGGPLAACSALVSGSQASTSSVSTSALSL